MIFDNILYSYKIQCFIRLDRGNMLNAAGVKNAIVYILPTNKSGCA